jgi:succinoglycan biosynthesis transport protein ExoP
MGVGALFTPGSNVGPSIDPSQVTQTPLRQYLSVLKRGAWLVALVPAVTLAATAAVTFTKQPVYRASMKIVVAQAGTGVDQTPEFGSPELMQTMTTLLESEVIADGVIDDLRLETTPVEFLKHLHATYTPGSSVLDVTFDSTSKRAVAPILAQVAEVYQALVRNKLGSRSGAARGEALPLVNVEVFDPAHRNPKQISPKPVRTLAFAGVLGLAFGLAFAFLREGLDERVRSQADAEDWFESPVIASLPKRLRGGRKATVMQSRAENPSLAGSVEVLRANVLYSQPVARGPAILITSPMPEEGKSLVAANLAFALASGGGDVICIDADLRRPSIHRYLGLDLNAAGLSDVLTRRLDVEDALQQIALPHSGNSQGGSPFEANANEDGGRLRVLTAGSGSGESHDRGNILTAELVRDLVERLRGQADFVIFDGPPLFVADAFPLAVQADSVFVVARQGRTTREKARSARATLSGLGVEHVAVVLTDAAALDEYRYR